MEASDIAKAPAVDSYEEVGPSVFSILSGSRVFNVLFFRETYITMRHANSRSAPMTYSAASSRSISFRKTVNHMSAIFADDKTCLLPSRSRQPIELSEAISMS